MEVHIRISFKYIISKKGEKELNEDINSNTHINYFREAKILQILLYTVLITDIVCSLVYYLSYGQTKCLETAVVIECVIVLILKLIFEYCSEKFFEYLKSMQWSIEQEQFIKILESHYIQYTQERNIVTIQKFGRVKSFIFIDA